MEDLNDTKLTGEQRNVIFNKATEAAFSGEYDNFFANGTYLCRRCKIPLYKAKNKFDAGCGWPSFDQEIPGRVRRSPDPDGIRTEISCATCGAHLGHVFTGEKLTKTDERHCVNSLSLQFVPESEISEIETAVFGGGCFWCGEAVFKKLRGVFSVISGYSGGTKQNPTYKEVSGGQTGHAEVVKIEFNPGEIDFKTLLEVFFEMHDPTTLNRQGNDIGTQYRSVIFYTSEEQKNIGEKFINELNISGKYSAPIITALEPLKNFYPAEEYHMDYYAKNQNQPYCRLIISPKIKKITEEFGKIIKNDK